MARQVHDVEFSKPVGKPLTQTRAPKVSRSIGYETTLPPLPYARELEILAFDSRRIKSFIEIWYGQETDMSKALLAELEKSHQIKGLARIPLMLSLICCEFPQEGFPLHRSQLYESCLRGLLRTWVLHDQKPGVTDIQLDGAFVEILLKRRGH